MSRVERASDEPRAGRRLGLPPASGKATDSRAGGFLARHGELVQVKLDALAPDALRALYHAAIGPYSDTSAFERALTRERTERSELVAGRSYARLRPITMTTS